MLTFAAPSPLATPRRAPRARVTMVEGHAVQRLAAAHRANLMRRVFRADSPNGRFDAGAAAIDGRVLARVEAVGKNLFHFYDARGRSGGAGAGTGADSGAGGGDGGGGSSSGGDTTVVHIHFGMSGQFRTAPGAVAPAPKPTTRLRLTEVVEGADDGQGLVGLVSAQLLVHGGMEVYDDAKQRLGPDPLREDADEALFLEKAGKTSKSIGAVLMDQTFVAGVGNIYRAEICYKARVHPDEPSNLLTADQLRLVWHHSVDLLQRGFVSGSIITTDGAAAKAGRRRYVYNQSTCLCSARVKSWDIAQRRAYACLSCQPRIRAADGSVVVGPSSLGVKDVKVFPSRCAPDAPGQRLAAPAKMRVAELRMELESRGLDVTGGKPVLVGRLSNAIEGETKADEKAESLKAEDSIAKDAKSEDVHEAKTKKEDIKDVKAEDVVDEKLPGVGTSPDTKPRVGTSHLPEPVSAAVAAAEKAAIGESRAVEHVADVSNRTDLATAAGKLKVVHLKAQLRGRGLNASGTKAVIAERLVCAVLEDGGSLTMAPMRAVTVKEESGVKMSGSGAARASSDPDPEEVPQEPATKIAKVESRLVKRGTAEAIAPATRRSSRRRKE